MPQALIAAAAVVALLGAAAAVYIAHRHGRRRAAAAEARALELRNDVLESQAKLHDLLGRQLAIASERTQAALAELGERLEAAERGRLVGRYVLVNTPKPDDQTLRGWVRAEHEDGALELGQAEYLETKADGKVAVTAVGDVLIRAYSFAGFLEPPAAN